MKGGGPAQRVDGASHQLDDLQQVAVAAQRLVVVVRVPLELPDGARHHARELRILREARQELTGGIIMRPNKGGAHHADVRVFLKDGPYNFELLLQVVLPHIPKLDVHVLERSHDLGDRLLGPLRLRRRRCSVPSTFVTLNFCAQKSLGVGHHQQNYEKEKGGGPTK